MARHKLTDTQVKAAAPGSRLGDGDGLWLYVSATGNRSWVFIYRRGTVRREMGLGAYGTIAGKISLREARQRADEVRDIVKRGLDPRQEASWRRSLAKSRTFGEVANELLASKGSQFKNEKHKAQWKMTLEVYAKSLRKLPVADVSTDDVARVLRPIWQEKSETASRLRGRIEKVLDYAKVLGLRSGENPARWKGHLDHVLGDIKRRPKHHSAMPWVEVPRFMVKLRKVDGYGARALEWTVLTAARTGETLAAEWSEIDRDAKLWTVPAGRMKAGLEHVVPLSDAALSVLDWLGEHRINDWLFPGQSPKKPISNMTMTAVLKRMDLAGFTTHGFRSSFRDWAGDRSPFPREVVEQALAHRVGDATELAYRRGTALEKRRELMQAWSDYIAKVKPDG